MSEKLYKIKPFEWRKSDLGHEYTHTCIGVIKAGQYGSTSLFYYAIRDGDSSLKACSSESLEDAKAAAWNDYLQRIGVEEIYAVSDAAQQAPQPAPSHADALASIFAAADKLSAAGSRGRFDQAFAAYIRHPKDEGVRKLALHVMMSELAQVEVVR